MSQAAQQSFGSPSAGPGGFPAAPILARDNPGQLIPARPGFLPGALPGRGGGENGGAAPANRGTAVAASAPQQGLVNGLPFGGSGPLNGLGEADATVVDAVLPFGKGPASDRGGAAAVAPPPMVGAAPVQPPRLTPPPAVITADVPAVVPAPKSVPPPGFVVASPPTPSEPPRPIDATVTEHAGKTEIANGDVNSPWLRETPPPAPVIDIPKSEPESLPPPPVVEKKSSKMPLFIGLAVVLLGGAAAGLFVLKDKFGDSTDKNSSGINMSGGTKTKSPGSDTSKTASPAPSEVASTATASSSPTTPPPPPQQLPPPVIQNFPPPPPPGGTHNPNGHYDPNNL
jgi:hypothetical protein